MHEEKLSIQDDWTVEFDQSDKPSILLGALFHSSSNDAIQ